MYTTATEADSRQLLKPLDKSNSWQWLPWRSPQRCYVPSQASSLMTSSNAHTYVPTVNDRFYFFLFRCLDIGVEPFNGNLWKVAVVNLCDVQSYSISSVVFQTKHTYLNDITSTQSVSLNICSFQQHHHWHILDKCQWQCPGPQLDIKDSNMVSCTRVWIMEWQHSNQ